MTPRRWARDPTVHLVGDLAGFAPVDPDAIVVIVSDRGKVDAGLADEAIALVVERLRADVQLDAAAPLVAVTDAMKVVDDEGRIVETLDRAGLGAAGRPMAVRGRAVNAGVIEVVGWV